MEDGGDGVYPHRFDAGIAHLFVKRIADGVEDGKWKMVCIRIGLMQESRIFLSNVSLMVWKAVSIWYQIGTGDGDEKMVKMFNVGDLRMYPHEFYAYDVKNIGKSVSLYCARAKVGDWKMMELDRCVSSRQILIHIFET